MEMKDIIRKYRKMNNMTQEEMANRLGVTAPAVNKWESGSSLPDIMLLAPIARLLGISLDTLLSFREELTGEEIKALIEQASIRIKKDSYEDAFQWAKKQFQMYPNCENLLWQMTLVFDVERVTKEIPDTDKYDEDILNCYKRLLESKNETIRSRAADSLFGFYTRKEDYTKAEEYLSYFSNENPEKKRKQAMIYSKTNRLKEAYQAYEELLFSEYQMISMALYSIFMLALEEEDNPKAHMLAEKQKALAGIFEMGKYHEVSCGMELAIKEKDADTAFRIMKEMFENVESICDFCGSALYSHMTYHKPKPEFYSKVKENLKNSFQGNKDCDFLKADKRWTEFIK